MPLLTSQVPKAAFPRQHLPPVKATPSSTERFSLREIPHHLSSRFRCTKRTATPTNDLTHLEPTGTARCRSPRLNLTISPKTGSLMPSSSLRITWFDSRHPQRTSTLTPMKTSPETQVFPLTKAVLTSKISARIRKTVPLGTITRDR